MRPAPPKPVKKDDLNEIGEAFEFLKKLPFIDKVKFLDLLRENIYNELKIRDNEANVMLTINKEVHEKFFK